MIDQSHIDKHNAKHKRDEIIFYVLLLAMWIICVL